MQLKSAEILPQALTTLLQAVIKHPDVRHLREYVFVLICPSRGGQVTVVGKSKQQELVAAGHVTDHVALAGGSRGTGCLCSAHSPASIVKDPILVRFLRLWRNHDLKQLGGKKGLLQ